MEQEAEQEQVPDGARKKKTRRKPTMKRSAEDDEVNILVLCCVMH